MAPDSDRDPLEESFSGAVVPEATPNPRSIRFVTPPIHDGPSRWYESGAGADDARVTRLFAEFDDVANVLVGPAFVAIGLHRPDRWEALLDPLLRVVTAEFASSTDQRTDAPISPANRESPAAPPESTRESPTALERAWTDLGSLRPAEPADLERILAAVSSNNSADRQVAARLVVDADAVVSDPVWGGLLDDASRVVRRAVVDAMVDAARPSLRPLLERALLDDDAWTRWKALRGLVELGIEPSRAAVTALADDPDFRVRLEVARASRHP